jgi:signal transduction histidine kinase
MQWGVALGVTVALIAVFSAGVAVGLTQRRDRLKRVKAGASELARGNFGHRVVLPGNDDASLIAEDLNAIADAVQLNQETTAAREDARRRLLANISHDLRTPITSVAGYVDALQRGLGSNPEHYLAVLAAKADELAELTDDLFFSARLDAGDLELSRERFDLAEIVRRAILGFEPQLAGSGVRVSVDVPDEKCLVEADPSAVTRILANVVSNALRHGTGMTALSVDMSPRHGRYVVSIANDGRALPDDPERLFQRGVAGPSGGAGLGLSIARELAERMGATVSAHNAVGGRATFVLAFPTASLASPSV